MEQSKLNESIKSDSTKKSVELKLTDCMIKGAPIILRELVDDNIPEANTELLLHTGNRMSYTVKCVPVDTKKNH